jgi:hypothetical protein
MLRIGVKTTCTLSELFTGKEVKSIMGKNSTGTRKVESDVINVMLYCVFESAFLGELEKKNIAKLRKKEKNRKKI